MPRALVVFESLFGDNEILARAIARGLSPRMEVEVVRVDEAEPQIPVDLDLLVVGGPTQAFRMSRPSTREEAPQYKPGTAVPEGGVREWLSELAVSDSANTKAGAFGTNLAEPTWLRRMGKSAKGIYRRLRSRGFEMIASPEIFFVSEATGPLVEGEEKRAEDFGEKLARNFAPPEASRPDL